MDNTSLKRFNELKSKCFTTISEEHELKILEKEYKEYRIDKFLDRLESIENKKETILYTTKEYRSITWHEFLLWFEGGRSNDTYVETKNYNLDIISEYPDGSLALVRDGVIYSGIWFHIGDRKIQIVQYFR